MCYFNSIFIIVVIYSKIFPKSMKSWNHGTWHTISHHVSQEILHNNVVPIETYNHVSDNVRGGPKHTKNIETRNKQLEAQIAHERQRDLVLIKLSAYWLNE